MEYIDTLFTNLYFLVFTSACVAYYLTIKILPAIIFLSNTKNLMDIPGHRSMHVNQTPTMGGVGIFIALSLTLILFAIFSQLEQVALIKLLSLLAGLIILMFLGIKDDLLVLSPTKKFIGQIFSASIVTLMTDIRITDFGGLFGIYELSPIFSILFTILVFVFIINAFNLTDGIDGLAASIAIIASTTFGAFFILNGNVLFSLISFALIGALLSFLRFNLSDINTRKMFMGDSGSMFIGFVLAFQGIALLQMNQYVTIPFTLHNEVVVVLAVLAFPILDTLRVFCIRIKQGRSPFSADRNHIHHRLLDLGLQHKTATLIVCNVNIFVITLTLCIDMLQYNIHVQLLIVFTVAPLLYLFPFIIEREQGRIRFALPRLAS